MSDRIEELVAMAYRSYRCTKCVPSDTDTRCQECNALTELATIARENAFNATEARGVEEQYRKERDDARAEADKWRKVAETVAEIAADLSEEFVGAGVGPGEFIDEALRRILIKQEETK